MNQFAENSTITVNPNVAYTQMDDDMVMMIPGNSSFYGVNAVGVTIWTLLQKGPYVLSDIYDYILQEYDIDKAQCVVDVNQFINDLMKQGMVSLTN